MLAFLRLTVLGALRRPILWCLLFLLPASAWAWPWGIKWQELTPEETAMTEPSIDPDAGAEILLREVEVDDSRIGSLTRSNYMRFKVFDQRGVEDLNPMEIEVERKVRVRKVAARVIKPDGTVVQLDKDDIYSRETMRDDDERWRTVSFSFPGIEPGCIVEYQWDEVQYNTSANGTFFLFAARYPIHEARFRFRPYMNFAWQGNMLNGAKMEEQHGGYRELVVHNLQALPKEPMLPPRFDYQPWIAISYRVYKEYTDPDSYWELYGEALRDEERSMFKSGKREIREKAEELTAGATTPEEKVERIYNFCTHEIRNIHVDIQGQGYNDVPEDLENDHALDTLRNGAGNSSDISILFASLVEAAGMEAHLALAADRSRLTFMVTTLMPQSIPDLIVVVKLAEDRWMYADPGMPFVPYGMLHWSNESTYALISGRGKPQFLPLPPSAPERTQVKRRADLSVDEEGNVSGRVVLTYSGHAGMRYKYLYNGDTPGEREDRVREEVQERLPTAELNNIIFTNLTDPDQPLEVSFGIKVPAYGDVAVQRIFLQPSFFEKGGEPLFKKEKRQYGIDFHYMWECNDDVRISYPDNYEVEEGRTPESIGENEYFTHQIVFGKAKNRNLLVYRRKEAIKLLGLTPEGYDYVKGFFDLVYDQDQHIVTLRPKADDAPIAAAE